MKKVVQDLTSGGIDWQREKWQSGLGSKFIHQGEKNAVKYADEVIVLSKGVQDYFKETYDRETHFIPNGVNRPQIREAKLITDHFGLEKDSYILFLGRLVPEKGIRYLVEAFKNVKTDKKLVIAGGSSDTDSFMEELKELAKGDDRILFTGFVQGAMLDELYSNAYIYTLPSDLEGMPLSLLEAMSYGNCCLVSDIPECAEVVEDKALIFKKSDVEDLREKLQDACDHAHQCITATHSGQLSIPLLDLLVLDQRIGQAFCQFAVCLCLCVCGNRSLLCSCNSIPVPVDWGGKPRYNKRNDLFTAAGHEENKLWK